MRQHPGLGFNTNHPLHNSEKRKDPCRGHRQLYATQVAPLVARDQLEEAEPILKLLLQSRSELPEVYRDLAELERRRAHHDNAKLFQDRWLNLPADCVAHLWQQANVAEELGRVDLAIERYQLLLQLNPQHQDSLQQVVDLLLRSTRWTEAQPLINNWLEREPLNAGRLAQAAFCALMLHQRSEAENYARLCLKEIKHAPLNPVVSQSQATSRAVLARLNQTTDEISTPLALAECALTDSNNSWPVNYILAPLFLSHQRLPTAARCIDEALLLLPASAELHLLKANLLLLECKLQAGFQELKWSHLDAIPPVQHGLHHWNGPQSEEPIALLSEGIMGDTLLFSRYANWIQDQTKQSVALYVQPPLVKLLRNSLQPLVSVLPYELLAAKKQGSYLPLLSAPALFGTCQEHKELSRPHLQADPILVEYWKQQLDIRADELLIGINWHGSALHALSEDHRSDIPLLLFAPLAELSGVRLVAFQKGIGSEQLAGCSFKERFVNCQSMVNSELRLEHMAAVMSRCDWLVSDDSGPAHLAGNLGIPSLVLLPERINWRWASPNGRAPWYPNSRLLRQQPGTGWQELMQQACQKITAHPKDLTDPLPTFV